MGQDGESENDADERASGVLPLNRASVISSDEEDDEHTFHPISNTSKL